ncbi:uncharacterized protein HD556DRAFT_1447559 [Suillus plorans]|uniref:Uncharacterized protein n=1 Tax=Suillus plorans TaxID=116603 RepID=A0A9P7AHY5_9AGAM|nr:uncharacterized protein HD556DRAFT_1447559 [Suillus plorans]KAG1788711.1 hypothetical protein HD556DRAFT_1447559 [Suillus plorans]
MSLCATTCVKVPCFKLSTPLQHPFTPSYTSSHVGSPPSTPSVSPRGSVASTVLESDDDSFPLTPDSKHSGDTHHVADISCRAGPSTSISRYHKQHHIDSYNYSFHPYRRAPSFQDRCAFECMLGSSDCDNSLEDMKGKTDDWFLRHMDALGPQSFRLVVHYKEAVREHQRLDLFVAYWAREESKRLDNLHQFMLQAAQGDFVRAEREASVLMKRLLEKHPPSTDIDAQSLAMLSEHNKKYLCRTDTQLDLLKDCIVQRQMASSRDDDSNNNLDAAA